MNDSSLWELNEESIISYISALCVWSVLDVVLDGLYLLLLICCFGLICKHSRSLCQGSGNGLIWYLVCTSTMCFFRSIGFVIIPFLRSECSDTFSYFQWDIGGTTSDSNDLRLSLVLLILSSSSSGLFFSSYSYLAYSLAKVLDMLTSDHTTNQTNSGYPFFLVLLAQNACVWISVTMLWLAIVIRSDWVPNVDNTSRFLVSVAALTTGIMFSTHVIRASLFLKRMNDSNSVRASQLERLLKLRFGMIKRVNGVCRVCTVCFVVKGTLIAYRATLSPLWVFFYLLGFDIAPTAYMLYVFSSAEGQSSSMSAIVEKSSFDEEPPPFQIGMFSYGRGRYGAKSMNLYEENDGDFGLNAHETTRLLSSHRLPL